MLRGKKTYLTSIDIDSLEQLREWRNRADLRKYFREYRELSSAMQTWWYEEKCLKDKNQVNFEIHDIETDRLIGHTGLYYIDWVNRYAEWGGYIGDSDFRSGGYGSDMIKTCLKYGFSDLNLNKVWIEVYDNNTALDIYKHIGFKLEGTKRQHYYNEGKYWDAHILSILKDEYEIK